MSVMSKLGIFKKKPAEFEIVNKLEKYLEKKHLGSF